jgi:hypothetical protein
MMFNPPATAPTTTLRSIGGEPHYNSMIAATPSISRSKAA